MKNLFMLAALLGLLAIGAQAQTTYPGQMAVVGTMTVQGNAFSVGGSTFTVSAGTINAGVLLKVSAAGIQWADGNVSTTSGGGGTGNASLSANQTFSGQNIFSAVTSFGDGAIRSSFTTNGDLTFNAASRLLMSGTTAFYAGNNNVKNVYGGYQAAANITNESGQENTILGAYAGQYIGESGANVIIGAYAGNALTGPYYYNTMVGRRAGEYATGGNSNTYLGQRAGHDNLTGGGNVMIGYTAGSGWLGSDRLCIGATNDNCLVQGTFGGDISFGGAVKRSSFTNTGDLTMAAGAALTMAGPLQPQKRTKAQFDSITPAVGDTYICSNCTVPYDICVATDTAVGSFRATIYSAISTVTPGTLVSKGCGVGQ